MPGKHINNPVVPKDYITLEGSERHPSPSAKHIAPADPKEILRVTISLRRRPNGPPIPGHDHYLKVAPAERQRMSHDEFAGLYGASPDDIDKVTAFATSRNLTVVETNAARRTVVVEGTVAQMSDAFAVGLARYEHDVRIGRGRKIQKETYRGRDGFIHIPKSLESIVVGVFGLDNRRVGRHNGAEPPNTSTISVPTVYKLYDYPTNSASGQTIGIFSLSGYASGDITQYFNSLPAGYTAPALTDILINGATNPGSDPIGETTQDIEIAAAFAPGSAINVYITTSDQQGWVQAITRVAHPNASDTAPSVLSSSWFICDGDDATTLANEGITTAFLSAVTAAFQDAAIQGITVCIASGDRGSDSNVGDKKAHVQYPGSDPWVLTVGGTTLGNVNGTSFDEYVWNDPAADPNNSNWGTTGGGVSDFFAVPSYQANAGVPASVNDPNHRGRGVPDVAGNANIASGYSGIVIGGSTSNPGNGTSASAPQWAGLIAVMNAALGVNLGFVNPAFYALGSSYFRDIVPGSGPADNSNSGAPGYPAGSGWDACTGWGTPRGNLLLEGLRSIFTRKLYFIVDKNTFGVDEVADVVNSAGGLYSSPFWLVLEGFSISQLGALTPTLSGPFKALAGVTVFPDGSGISYQNPGDLYTPQRIRIAYNIIFTQQAVDNDFPAAGSDPNPELLTASITIAGTTLTAEALFELATGADPYFTNVDPVNDQYFYLSQDLRVFSAAAGDTPLPGAQPISSDPYQSIQNLLSFLNSTSAYTTPGPDLLNGLPGQTGYETGDSSVTPLNGAGNTNFNFAIARVRLQGTPGISSANNVRVFFRLFIAQSCDTDFQPSTTYLSQPGTGTEAGKPVFPLPSATGLSDPSGQSIQTVPFFATDSNGTHDYDGTNANGNIRTIALPASQDKLWAYFGCFLDVYSASNQSIFPGTHHCIVAEIAYDDTPIVNSGGVTLSPENTDKLAQRNLQITSSGNPGYPDTHRIPQAFDLRPSAPPAGQGQLQEYPDELMIDWGNIPPGSIASIFWPKVNAQDVLDLASKFYGAHKLMASDAHTIQCKTTNGVAYVPIPVASGINFAGLFTVELPNTIHTGEEFNAQVRRVTSRRLFTERGVDTPVGNLTAAADKPDLTRNWRYVTGTFQVKVPVGNDKKLLLPEENTLAILKWRLLQYPPTYRWRPVLERYITYISGRVSGFGGDPGAVKPSPTGLPHGGKSAGKHECERHGNERIECTGKVSSIVYDLFGDFEGFCVQTEHGEHRYHNREGRIEKLVSRAWVERILITVVALPHCPHHSTSIVFRQPPRRFEE